MIMWTGQINVEPVFKQSITELFSFGKKSHAVHVSFARPVSCGHLPEAHSIINGILLPKTEQLQYHLLTGMEIHGKTRYCSTS